MATKKNKISIETLSLELGEKLTKRLQAFNDENERSKLIEIFKKSKSLWETRNLDNVSFYTNVPIEWQNRVADGSIDIEFVKDRYERYLEESQKKSQLSDEQLVKNVILQIRQITRDMDYIVNRGTLKNIPDVRKRSLYQLLQLLIIAESSGLLNKVRQAIRDD